jgi:hypothetical protein
MLYIVGRSKGSQNWVRQAVIAFTTHIDGRSLSISGDINMLTL